MVEADLGQRAWTVRYEDREEDLMELTTDNFSIVSCASCGLEFCLPKTFEGRRLEDCATWYCPNGHAQAFIKPKGDSKEVKKLKEDVARLEDQLREARLKHHLDPDYVKALEFLEHNPDWIPPWRKEDEDVPSGG